VYLDCTGPAGTRSVGIRPRQLLGGYRATQAAIYSRVGILLRLERFDRDPAAWLEFAYSLLGRAAA
jgi:hypothetical protein